MIATGDIDAIIGEQSLEEVFLEVTDSKEKSEVIDNEK